MKTLTSFCAGLGALVVLAGSVFGNAITVDSTADGIVNPGVCTLRAAIKAAEMHGMVDTCAAGVSGEDTIGFASGVTGVITLNSTLPTLTESLQITGPGAGVLKIDANGANEIFHIVDGDTHHFFTISGLTLSGAAQQAIFAFGGNLKLDAMVLTQNHTGMSFGHADDTLEITGSTFADNGDATVSGGGGGLNFLGGHLKLSDTTISGNEAAGGGGIQLSGDLSNCMTPCSADLTNVTIFNNKTTGSAGGMSMAASVGSVPVTLTNVTIAGNRANTDGGTGGFGGGIFLQSNVELTLKNTLIANNVIGIAGTTQDDCRVVGGTLTSNGANLIREISNCTGLVATDITGEDPLLGDLAANGGPTQTLLLLEGSPAVDAAKASDAPSKDQRGVTRPLGGAPDIGAVEVGCGDGVVETGEACDDGNTAEGDGCGAACEIESPGTTGGSTTGGTTAGGATGGTAGSTAGSDSEGGCSLVRRNGATGED